MPTQSKEISQEILDYVQLIKEADTINLRKKWNFDGKRSSTRGRVVLKVKPTDLHLVSEIHEIRPPKIARFEGDKMYIDNTLFHNFPKPIKEVMEKHLPKSVFVLLFQAAPVDNISPVAAAMTSPVAPPTADTVLINGSSSGFHVPATPGSNSAAVASATDGTTAGTLNTDSGGFLGWLHAKANFFHLVKTYGFSSAGIGFILGALDELLGPVVDNFKPGLWKILRCVISGAGALVLLAVFVMALHTGLPLIAIVIKIVASLIMGIVGSTIGKLFGKLLKKLLLTCFPSLEEIYHAKKSVRQSVRTAHVGCALHQNEPRFIEVGNCVMCWEKPALCGFIHAGERAAHTAYCETCLIAYHPKKCVCNGTFEGVFSFKPESLSECMQCIPLYACQGSNPRNCVGDGSRRGVADNWVIDTNELNTAEEGGELELQFRFCDKHVLEVPQEVSISGKLHARGVLFSDDE